MSTATAPSSTTHRPIDPDKVMAFVFRAIDEVGATLNTALVVMGDKLGYYRALADQGPATAGELADRTRHRPALQPGMAGRPGRRRVPDLRPGDGAVHPARRARGRPDRRDQPGLPARVLPDRGRARWPMPTPSSTRPGAATGSAGISTTPTCTSAANGSSCPGTTPTSSRPGCRRWTASSTSSSSGALVADVGCGHGASTIVMAQAFPRSRFVGSDYHAGSIATARQRALEAGVADRVSFREAPAGGFAGSDYDLVTTFDALHDMGDPVGAARHIRREPWHRTAPG